MLKQEVIKKLAPEYQALYLASLKKRIDTALRSPLKYAIQDIRIKTTGEDLLANKLNHFGNKGSWGNAKMKDLQRAIFDYKGPLDNETNWIAVEIEQFFRNNSAYKDFLMFVRKEKLTKFITVKDDGSLNDRDDVEHECHDEDGNVDYECKCSSSIPKEIVVLSKYGEWDVITKVCSKLNSLNSFVNKSCGLHVHFDFRGLKTSHSVTLAGRKVASCVDALKQLLPPSRRNNQYCQKDINTMKGGGRYAFVNLQSYKKHSTLEIRGHSGTVDAKKIINWIRINKAIMMSKPSKVNKITVAELVSSIKFDNDLVDYMFHRQAKFNGDTKSSSDTLDTYENNEIRQTA